MQIIIQCDLSKVSHRLLKYKFANKATLAISMKLASDKIFVRKIKDKILKDGRIFRGNFHNSIRSEVTKGWFSVSLEVGSFGVRYAPFIEKGTGPAKGRNPPFDMQQLIQYVKFKRLVRADQTPEQAAFALYKHLMKHGAKKHPTITPVINRNVNQFFVQVSRELKNLKWPE